ncbi:MAG: phosphatidate cytidylyltransferase, partial [Thiotrichales bacterium]|nr:phosphatidate cytidylyltransferase [Thiotrichales bacterium]
MALKQRVLTAAVLIPPVVLAIVFLDPLLFALLIAAVIALASWEWSGLSGLSRSGTRLAYLVSMLLLMYLACRFQTGNDMQLILFVALA